MSPNLRLATMRMRPVRASGVKADPKMQHDSKDITKRTANLLRGQPRAIALWMIGMFGGTMDHKSCDKDTQESFQRGVRGCTKEK